VTTKIKSKYLNIVFRHENVTLKLLQFLSWKVNFKNFAQHHDYLKSYL